MLKRYFHGSAAGADDVATSPKTKDAAAGTKITIEEIAVLSELKGGATEPTPPVSTSPSETLAKGDAEPTLVTVPFTAESTSILGLWDFAYENLREEDATTVEEYEKKLHDDLGTGLGSTMTSSGRQELMDTVLQRKMDDVNSKSWKLRFGTTEVLVKDLAQPVLGIISRVNGYVSDALAPNPSASMAWAGISLLLPLLTNPSKQATALAKALEHIARVVAQSRMWEELY
ncbi:hypothetical protein C8A05DRAFT_19196, partial [Staphylotrichum tortipilum]